MSAMPPLAHESSLRLPRREPRASFALGAANLLLLLGGIGAGASAAAVVYFLAIDMQGAEFDAHRGLLAFVALPGLMIFFLALAMVAGWWRRRTAAARPPETEPGRRPPGRRSGRFLLLSMTALAVPLLLGAVGFRAVSFMESAKFCAACHGVMGPQVQAHQVSPHAEVACTKCHIGAEAGPVGPGSGEYIKAKIGGMRQTLSVVLNDYDRPIRAPAGKIPHTAETCEGCHSPDKDYGVSVRVYRSYLPDEGNTSHRRVLAFRVGGGGKGEGDNDVPAIHWHATARVWYTPADETKQAITWAGVETDEGMVEWTNPNAGPSDPVSRRLMDCTDCHNRIGHEIPFPGALVDQAIREGRLDASLPYLKREALELLGADGTAGDVDRQVARVQTPGWFDELRRFYEQEYPEIASTRASSIDAAIEELKLISAQTLYPDMRTNWQTYPDNLQHSLPDGLDLVAGDSAPGCFRCHGTLQNRITGERLAGTMGGEGCLACHGLAEGGGGVQVPSMPDDVQGCALCHVSVSEEEAGLWLGDNPAYHPSPR